MVSMFTILTNLLLASGILAVHSSSHWQLKARLARRHENRRSIDTRDDTITTYYDNWGGAAVTESEGTFTNVTGTFVIPALNGSESAVTVWTGIDGPTCTTILQAGVDLVVRDGNYVHVAWVEWYPDPCYYYSESEFNISVGDEIRSTVVAYSTTSGKAIIENLTTRQTVTKEVSSSSPLCGQNAEWIAEDFMHDIPLADFGTITFTNATASGPSGRRYTPQDANIIFELQRPSTKVLTSVSVSGDTVSIKRI